MVRLPLIGAVSVVAFILITSIIARVARRQLQPRLQGREPCRKWFTWLASTVAGSVVFTVFTVLWGIGSVEAGIQSALFGMFGGLVWGGILAAIQSHVFWQAFDEPRRDRQAEREEIMNTDLGELLGRLVNAIKSFRPRPSFRATGTLAWIVFASTVLMTMFWSMAFCVLTWLTEGSPGEEPILPLDQ